MSLSARFWSKVDKSGDCWEWIAGKDSHGYGHFRVDGSMQKAHRWAWAETHGHIPRGDDYHGICVCHRCDNPSCVNPDHLFLGSNADNVADRVAKGRSKGGGATKLHESDIPVIKELSAIGETQETIAERFGINRSQVSKIVRGVNWAHV